MSDIRKANWVKSPMTQGDAAVVFHKQFSPAKEVAAATLEVSALGVYFAELNGERVGDFILAPGWTSYANRVQFQSYDVTAQLKAENDLAITLGKGWRFLSKESEAAPFLGFQDNALIAALRLDYADGDKEILFTDDSWQVTGSPIRYNNIYNGETYDAQFCPGEGRPAAVVDHDKHILISQQGEFVTEHERLPAMELIHTPAGETVIDFGQNVTGYLEFTIQGSPSHTAQINHTEVLDKDGNFYTENLRSAKQTVTFVCDGNKHTYKPKLTFYGFRYLRLIDWPDEVDLKNFTTIAVHSDMKRSGYFECGEPLVNQLFHNIIWGQKGNFLDVPTDCPQRDERLGWTGDAQVFVRTASYNFDVEKFFTKWLGDLKADQNEDGSVPHVIPASLGNMGGSAAWADAAVICPWQIYLSYGNKAILTKQYSSMKQWIEYMRANAKGFLWTTGFHFGDWLDLHDPEQKNGSFGSSPKELIASAYFYYSTSLFIKAGLVLGKDMSEYELLRENIGAAFRKRFMKEGKMKAKTQTACVLALYFGLTDQPEVTAAQLAERVRKAGHLTTGFVGTAYLMHALSDNGYASLAYDLLLRTECPSWLYQITMGATTIWERWDSMKPDGSMNDAGMTSFNHYAYGCVGDWLYGVAAGINTDESAPGFQHIVFRPIPDKRLGYVKASIESRQGVIRSEWRYEGDTVQYSFTVPEGCTATFLLEGKEIELLEGTHNFTK